MRIVKSGWFGVRCVFSSSFDDGVVYEERVTVWPADDLDEAIALAEGEARAYAADVDATYLGLAQAYMMADELVAGAEVFSLARTSSLSPSRYLDAFFDTGEERQQHH